MMVASLMTEIFNFTTIEEHLKEKKYKKKNKKNIYRSFQNLLFWKLKKNEI